MRLRCGNVGKVKRDDERGPRAAWAYHARDALNLSPEEVVRLLGDFSPSTIRVTEAGRMSNPLWERLVELYGRLAAEKGKTLPALPAGAERGQVVGLADLLAVLQRIDERVAALEAMANSLVGINHVGHVPEDDAAIAAAEARAAEEKARRPRRDPRPRADPVGEP